MARPARASRVLIAVSALALWAAAAPGSAVAAFEPRFEVAAAQQEPEEPRAAVDGDGNIHYVWQAFDPVANQNVIRTLRRAADGTLGPVRLLSDPSGNANDPHVAVDSAGNAHFVWDWFEDGKMDEVHARRIAADGTLGATRVLITADEFQGGNRSDVAVDAAGNAYFSWVHQDIRLVGDNFERIPDELELVRLSAAGALGTVEDVGTGFISGPKMAVNANGDAAFVWIDMASGTTGTFRGRRRSAAGSFSPIHNLTVVTGPNGEPDVAIDPAGHAHFVWSQFVNPVSDVRTRRLDADGLTLGAAQVLSAPGGGSDPEVAVDDAGVAHFLWSLNSGGSRTIQVRRRAVDATLGSTGDLGSGVFPHFAVDPAGNGHVAWTTSSGSGSVLQARSYRANGTLGPLQQLAPLGPRFDVTVNDEGFAAVTWGTGNHTIESAISGCLDTDGDALCDSWEVDGIDVGGNGSIDVDLPAMGADPQHKDIFVEIDSMAGHVLSQAAIDVMVDAFEAAPVDNPDGLTGITVHVDNGASSTMNPVTGATWGASLTDADVLGDQAVLGSFNGGSGNYDWSAFDAIKQANFKAGRELAFHYVISGHRYGSATNNRSGISRNGRLDAFDLGGSDLLVTLGPASEPGEGVGSPSQQVGTLMHELGHNLGLKHGGDDHTHYKPSYLSIMNYAFQMTGLRRADGTFQFDYSRVPISIDETDLDESVGFNFAAASVQAQYMTGFLCPGSALPPTGQLFVEALSAGPIDFDCDGLIEGSVPADVNSDGNLSTFGAFLDWPALVFGGGSVGDAAGASAPLPADSPTIEPQLAELLANQKALESASNPGTDPGQPGNGGSGGSGGGGGTPGGTTPPGGDTEPLKALVFVGSRVSVTRAGQVKLRLRNPNPVAVTGTLKLDMPAPARGRGAATRRVVLATTRFSIGPAARRTVTLRLRRKDLRTLVRGKRLAVRARVTMSTATGAKLSASRNLSLLAPRRR